jgi:predicted DNA binding CopG/RHH family protein|tara:strand:+ start:190 stop:348 length:159 start_codon:yes stop_codon:yes gene_type:complete
MNSKTIEVVVRLPKKKLDQIKKKEGKKGLSDRAYILLAIDEYLNPIKESYII